MRAAHADRMSLRAVGAERSRVTITSFLSFPLLIRNQNSMKSKWLEGRKRHPGQQTRLLLSREGGQEETLQTRRRSKATCADSGLFAHAFHGSRMRTQPQVSSVLPGEPTSYQEINLSIIYKHPVSPQYAEFGHTTMLQPLFSDTESFPGKLRAAAIGPVPHAAAPFVTEHFRGIISLI